MVLRLPSRGEVCGLCFSVEDCDPAEVLSACSEDVAMLKSLVSCRMWSGDVRVSCNMLGWAGLRLIGLGLHMPLEQRELLLLLNQLSWTCTTQQHQQQQEQQEQENEAKGASTELN